jgi:ABC-type sugar transport system ATPase subunit
MSPLIEVREIGKTYGSVIALSDVSTVVNAGEVTCVLGDNGAGKSTLIKILAGVHQHDRGEFLVEGDDVRFGSPREALDRGIATVYQDLAVVPLMSVWRNFYLGPRWPRWASTCGTWNSRSARCPVVNASAWRSRVLSTLEPRCSSWMSPRLLWV